jgi:hypothetical protein
VFVEAEVVAKLGNATDMNSGYRAGAKINRNTIRLAMIKRVQKALARGAWSLYGGHVNPFNQLPERLIFPCLSGAMVSMRTLKPWLQKPGTAEFYPDFRESQLLKNARFCSYQAYTSPFPLTTDTAVALLFSAS